MSIINIHFIIFNLFLLTTNCWSFDLIHQKTESEVQQEATNTCEKKTYENYADCYYANTISLEERNDSYSKCENALDQNECLNIENYNEARWDEYSRDTEFYKYQKQIELLN